jgi:hypothetical protein
MKAGDASPAFFAGTKMACIKKGAVDIKNFTVLRIPARCLPPQSGTAFAVTFVPHNLQ